MKDGEGGPSDCNTHGPQFQELLHYVLEMLLLLCISLGVVFAFLCIFVVTMVNGSAGKESACNVRDLGLIPGLGRSPGDGKGYPLQYSSLENSIDYIVHGVTQSWT